MLKTFRFMLLAAFTMVCGNLFAQEGTSVTVKWEASVGNDVLPTGIGSDISLQWEKGTATSSNAPKVSYGELYFNSGNRVTIAGSSDAITITKIVFSFGSDGKATLVTCNASGLEESTEGITTSGLVTTWEGEANSLIFRNPSSDTKRRYIKKIEVTYNSAAPVVMAPQLALTANIADTYDMDVNSVFVVNYENKGTAAAENVKLALFVDGTENASETIGTLEDGNSGFWNAKYDVTKFEAGEHQVKLSLTADNAETVNVEKTVTFTKKAAQASYSISANAVTVPYDAESYSVVATLENTSEVAGENVTVELRKNISDALATETVASIAAGATEQVTLTVAKELFEEGQKTYYLYVNGTYLAPVTVTFEEAPATDQIDMSVFAIQGAAEIDLNGTNTYTVWYKNEGNVTVENADIILLVNDNEAGRQAVTVEAGQQGSVDFTLDVANLFEESEDLNQDATLIGMVNVDGDVNADNNNYTMTAKVVKTVAEPTFELTAEPFEIQLPAETFSLTATVKNTSEVAAENVEVKLFYNGVIATQTVEALAAGATATVTFADVQNPFKTAGEYSIFVQAPKATAEVKVTVLAEQEDEKIDMAVTAIQGISEVSLKGENKATVWYENKGNVAVTTNIVLLVNDNEAGVREVTCEAGKNGFVEFTFNANDFIEPTEDTEATLVAMVNVDNDVDATNNSFEVTLPVVSGEEVAEAAFELTVENVEVLTTDATVKVVVNVKNTGNAKADQVEVKLLQGMTQVGESKWIFGLEAGADQNVTFEFANFDKADTYELQAIAGKAGKFFNVVVKEPTVALAITDITGSIDLAVADNYLTVNVENTGSADITNAKVVLTVAGEDAELGEGTLQFVKAGQTAIASVKIITDGLEAGTLPVHAEVLYNEEKIAEFEKDVTVTDGTVVAEPTFSVTAADVEATLADETFDVVLTVKNTSEVAAENVAVKLYYNTLDPIAETTIEALAAGEAKDVTLTVNNTFTTAKTYELNAMVAGKTQVFFNLVMKSAPAEEVKDMAIETIQGSIDLNVEQNNVSVTVKNNGTVAVKNAKVTLSYNETVLEKTVSAQAGENGYAFFQIASEGIEGETLDVTAAVELEGDATPNDNTKTETLTVTQKTAAEPAFTLTAENVTLTAGQDATAVVKVTNTSVVDATDVEVKLLYGTMTVATQTVDIAAGETKDVEFTLAAERLNAVLAMLGGKTSVEMQAVAGANSCFFTVTVVEEVEPVVDMAIEAIQGATQINLKEVNKVQVWYKNNGNVKMENVAVMLSVNDHAQEQTVTVEAGKNGYVEFTIPTDIFEPAEDTEAELVAWVNVEGDADNTNDRVTKTLPIVSGEVEPAAEIALNPVSSFEVEAGEQTVNVTVAVFNNGEADAENVTVEIYKSYPEILATATFDKVEKGGSAMKTVAFTYTFEQGKDYEFTAFTNFKDADNSNQMQHFTISCPAPKADVAVAKIAPIAATTEEDVVIAATLKNNSDIDANEVKVGVYTIENLQYQLVGIMQKVDIAAGTEANVEFNLGKLAAGEYTYYVQVSEDANAQNNMQDVTVKVTEPVAETIDMAIQAVQGPAEINLKGENTYKVWYINEGNVTVENADIILLVNDNEAGRQAVTVEPGKNGMVEFTLDVTNLFEPTEDLGLEATIEGFVNVEGDVNTANNRSSMNATVVSEDEVPEPVFTIAAQPVEVEFGTEKFDVVATITSDIDAENVEVRLFYNQDIATQTVSLTANDPATVTFADVENPFTTAGEHTMYIIAGKATAEVAVTVKPEAVEETIDMAITAIQGLSQINLKAENKATVWYENMGTKDLENVVIMLSVNDDTQQQTVNVAAGKNGYVEFTLDTTNILAEDENAEVVAWVNVEGDQNADNNKVTKVVPVINGVAPVATFTVAAENVTVPFGAQSFDIVAVVENTGDINGDVKVVLLKGIETVATETVSVAAGMTATVTFTVEAPEGGFVAGTAMYYVQAGTDQAEVEVTFEAEDAEETVDMAIIAIQGLSKIDLTKENKVQVWYENKGTKDLENVTVMFSANDHALEQTVNVAAGKNGYVEFTIDAAWFEPTEDVEAELVAWVNVEGDADTTNDKVTRTVPVVYGEAVLSFTVADVTAKKDAASFDVNVTVANTGNGAANDVAVKVYDKNSAELATATIATIAAGTEETVTITIDKTYTEAGTLKNELQVWVTGLTVKWVNVTVTEGTVGIAAIKAVYGENVQIFNLAGKKVNDVRKGEVYIINGKKVAVK